MEVLGWFSNGDAAMGIVKYGRGHLYLVPPHVSQTLKNVQEHYIKGWEAGEYWNKKLVPREEETMSEEDKQQFWSEAKRILMNEGDPDGSEPDRILEKAMLKDAAERASFQVMKNGITEKSFLTPPVIDPNGRYECFEQILWGLESEKILTSEALNEHTGHM